MHRGRVESKEKMKKEVSAWIRKRNKEKKED